MPTSSWKGSVAKGEDGLWHMWLSELTEHCGIDSWIQNSRIVHATSTTPTGTYTRKDVVFSVYATEPHVVRGPKGEYVMYFTGKCNGAGHKAGDPAACTAPYKPCHVSTPR